MTRPLSHPDYEDLLGAYALDAVDGAEAAAVELHLLDCPRCRDEIARHRDTAAFLAHAGAAAPVGLWDRICGELGEAPPALALVRVPGGATDPAKAPATGSRRGNGTVVAGKGAEAAVNRARADVGGAAARWRRRVSVRPVVALAGVAAVVIGVLGFEISNLQGQVSQVRKSVNSGGLSQLADVALRTPGHETVPLSSTNKQELATAVIAPDGQGYLIDLKLAHLGSNQTYQLWGLTDGVPISLGLLGSAPSNLSFHVNFSQMSELMITVEPAGGVQQPDSAAVVTGTPTPD